MLFQKAVILLNVISFVCVPGILCASSVKTTTTSTAQASSTPACKFVNYLDTFDNYTATPLTPELTPVGFDGGLFYVFNIQAPLLNNSGVVPVSSPNVAVLGVDQDLTKLGITTLNPFGFITTAGTATKGFFLQEFYYACLVFTGGVPVPTGCGLEVYGYDTSGMRTTSVSYNYAPLDQTAAPMSRATLPLNFAAVLLRNVSIAIATSNVVPAATVLYIDNVSHTNCM